MLSCYSGAGGLDLGLHAAGFDSVGCLEIDVDARATLNSAPQGWRVFEDGDVDAAGRHLTPRKLGIARGELDVIAGGPPCQPFSKAAQWTRSGRAGVTDPRAASLTGMMQLVDSFLPKVLLIENVRGFTHGKDSALPVLEQHLNEINRKRKTKYRLQVFELDAAHYGTAQHRLRSICIACREGTVVRPPVATHQDSPLRAWDAIGHIKHSEPLPTMKGKWAELLACVPEGGNYLHLTAKGGGPEVFGYRTRYWSFLLKLAKDRPSWTLPASPGPGAGPFHWDNRPLSVQERLALQGFPADWELVGEERSRIRLAGNATPPPLAEAIARALVVQEVLDTPVDFPEEPVLPVRRRKRVPLAVAPADLPESYRHLVGPKEAHAGTGRGPAPRLDSSAIVVDALAGGS
ncbi:DNA cytosine methyltransferase [Actinosynnema sp. NPDC050436]|uniref:DNA cytosine methyltransferase n=1 Tax=Actinosynnema sp. NPDC050436 TaxID=3155659 RepID=UPI0033E95464